MPKMGPETMRFSRIDTDRNEYADESGRFVIERGFVDGPRGGRKTMWYAYEVKDGRLRTLAEGRRLRDLWPHIERAARDIRT